MAKWLDRLATALGRTGNNTHASVFIPPDVDLRSLFLAFVVEAVGATPTVTYKWQYSFDPPSVSDANATWIDLAYHVAGVTPEVAAVTTTRARTTVSRDVLCPTYGALHSEAYRRVRLVTTSNTNVTYHGEIMGLDTSL